MAKFGSVYQRNDKSKIQAVLKRPMNDGRVFVAESTINRRKHYIPAKDIHDGPYADGWSIVSGESGNDSNGGGPKR